MSYRKFSATQLFTGHELLNEALVLITDIQGVVESIVPYAEAGDDVQEFQGILTPGFINCHCHLELSHMKSIIPEKSGMIDFILSVLQQRQHTIETMHAAIEAAENEMLQNGIVAVGDICNNASTLLQKQKGNMYYHNFIEVSGFVPGVAEERFTKSVSFFNNFAKQYALPVESNSIVPHAPYSVSPELFTRIMNFPGNHILTMHNQESVSEEQLFRSKQGDFTRLYEELKIDISFFEPSGKTSLQTVLPYFIKNNTIILVHNVTTSENDINYLRSIAHMLPLSHLYFCLCPNANLYIGNSLPNVDLLRRSGYPIVMGTDSLASNQQLSILEEMKTLQHHFPQLALKEILQWATINGAKALQLDEMLGSFDRGKRPGILLINEVSENKISEKAKVERVL